LQSSEKYSFKNLELWKAAQLLAIDVCRAVDSFPNRRSADIVDRQLIRSITSVPANIAEGHGRFSLAAYRNHLSIAKGSATESQGWVDLLVHLGHLTEVDGRELERRCDAMVASLTRRIVALERQEAEVGKSKRIREDGPDYSLDEEEVLRFPGSKVPNAPEEQEL
jgi:four helix bundle protein